MREESTSGVPDESTPGESSGEALPAREDQQGMTGGDAMAPAAVMGSGGMETYPRPSGKATAALMLGVVGLIPALIDLVILFAAPTFNWARLTVLAYVVLSLAIAVPFIAPTLAIISGTLARLDIRKNPNLYGTTQARIGTILGIVALIIFAALVIWAAYEGLDLWHDVKKAWNEA